MSPNMTRAVNVIAIVHADDGSARLAPAEWGSNGGLMSRARESWRVVGAGCVAAMVVSCGPAAVEILGDAMVDAGRYMVDGGSAMRDASDGMTSDASAQAGCATSCTSSGIQRMMTADTDPARLTRGTAPAEAPFSDPEGPGHYAELAVGPLVVTYARHVGNNLTAGFYVSDTGSCDVSFRSRGAESIGITFDAISAGYGISTPAVTGNFLVRSGERLCVWTSVRGAGAAWAGFRPYE
jgi:hypothetical protein